MHTPLLPESAVVVDASDRDFAEIDQRIRCSMPRDPGHAGGHHSPVLTRYFGEYPALQSSRAVRLAGHHPDVVPANQRIQAGNTRQ